MEEAIDRQARHLRAVPGGSSAEAVEPPVEGERVPSGAGPRPARTVGATADAFRREDDLLRAVRLPGSTGVLAPPMDRTPRQQTAAGIDARREPGMPAAPATPRQGTPAIAERFDAIATTGGGPRVGASSVPAMIDEAIDRLRSPAGGAGRGLLPLGPLRAMAEAGDPRAGEWLLALLATLHRHHPGLRVDVRCDGVLTAVTSSEDSTVIESRRRRRQRPQRDIHIRVRPDRLAKGASGARTRGSGGHAGRALFATLLDSPLTVAELLDDGVEVGPGAAWGLIAHAMAAVPAGFGGTFVHCDGAGEELTVTMRPGRPIELVPGRAGSASTAVTVPRRATLAWLLGSAAPDSIEGDPELADQACRLAAMAFSPIRRRN